MASDGFWDVMSNKETSKIFEEFWSKLFSENEMAERLVLEARWDKIKQNYIIQFILPMLHKV